MQQADPDETQMNRMTAATAMAELKKLRREGFSCSIPDIQAAAELAQRHQIPALDALGAIEAGKLAVRIKADRAAWNLAHGWQIAEGWRKELGLGPWPRRELNASERRTYCGSASAGSN